MPTPEELLILLAIDLATALIGWLVMWCAIVVVDVLGSARPSDASVRRLAVDLEQPSAFTATR